MAIKTLKSVEKKDMYVTWDDPKSKQKSLSIASEALQSTDIINRCIGANTFRNIIPNISIREGMSRSDYENYRAVDSIPDDNPKEIIRACNTAYKRIGIIRNVIDMMSDFTVKGLRITHPVKSWERLGEEWAHKVNLKDRAERFVSNLLRQAIVIIKRSEAKITSSGVEKLQKATASSDIKMEFLDKKQDNIIPAKYTFINPLAVEITDDPLGYPIYWLRVNSSLSKKVFATSGSPDQQMLSLLPQELKLAAQKNKLIKLDPEKTKTFFYKKDDWELWGTPFLYSILDDLVVFEKMKLADITALDGAISHIRVWKLGDIKEKLMPTPAAVARLADMLSNAGHGGTLDLIWSADLTLEETSTDIHQFLGDTKYKQTLENIYTGLGVPPTLTGSGDGGKGFTNNFISLRTLTERLSYVRDILISFLKEELKLLQVALGIRKPFYAEFDRISLTDEAAEKALLIQLADRNIIPLETVQRMFGETPEIAAIRLRRQDKLRKDGRMPSQAGPFHTAEKEHELNKIVLQSGMITPSQIGMELEEPKPGEEPLAVQKIKMQKEKSKGIPQQGRPKNSNDKKKRKQKRVVPRTSAMLWANKAQEKVSEIVNPIYLEGIGVKTVNELTDEQRYPLHELKFKVMSNLKLDQEIDINTVAQFINSDLPSWLTDLRTQSINKYVNKAGVNWDKIEQIEANIIGLIVAEN